MEQNLAKLAKSFEEFTLRHVPRAHAPSCSTSAAAGSSSDDPRVSNVFIGTPRATATDRIGNPAEELRTKLVHFPYAVANGHMKALHSKLREYYTDAEMWGSAVPNFPGGGNQFGIVFATRSDAVKFVDTFRADPYKYRVPDEPDEICLRVTPPRSPVVKRKGVLAAQVYEHVGIADFRGRLRTTYPGAGLPRAVLSAAMASERLAEVAQVIFDGPDEDMSIVEVQLFDVVNKIEKATGIKPKEAGKRGADARASRRPRAGSEGEEESHDDGGGEPPGLLWN